MECESEEKNVTKLLSGGICWFSFLMSWSEKEFQEGFGCNELEIKCMVVQKDFCDPENN